MDNLAYTAAQRRRELERRHFPQGVAPTDIKLLDEVEQLLIKAYHAGAEQSCGAAWSNQSALGYAIMAAEQEGLPNKQIHQLVRSMHNRFDFKALAEAAEHYRQSDY